MKVDLQRAEYITGKLDETDLKSDPFDQFSSWFKFACDNEVIEPNAMSLATAGDGGTPRVRTVLLKTFDTEGFVFFTNLRSHKARHLAENPQASLLFPWLALQRQVIASGRVTSVSREDAEAYFSTRPRGSQIGAWISEQSAVVASREELETQWAETENRFAGQEVLLPEWWGGYRVMPHDVEFWQGRVNRLHDRFRYTRQDNQSWKIERLAP